VFMLIYPLFGLAYSILSGWLVLVSALIAVLISAKIGEVLPTTATVALAVIVYLLGLASVWIGDIKGAPREEVNQYRWYMVVFSVSFFVLLKAIIF